MRLCLSDPLIAAFADLVVVLPLQSFYLTRYARSEDFVELSVELSKSGLPARYA